MDLVPSPRKSLGRSSQALSPAPQEGQDRAVGGIIEHLPGPSSQVSWRPGYSTRDEGAYPGAPAPTCVCPGSLSPTRVAERPGAPASHRPPFFPFPAFAGAGLTFPPGLAWGRVGRSCRTGQEAGLGLREGNLCSLPNRLLSLFPPVTPVPRPSPLIHFWQGLSSLGTPCPPEGPYAPCSPIWLVQNDNDTRSIERAWPTPWRNCGSRVCEGCGFI